MLRNVAFSLRLLPLLLVHFYAMGVAPQKTPGSAPAASASDVTSNVAVQKGLPVVQQSKLGQLNLVNLPTAPDGRKMVALVNGEPILLEHFMSSLKKALGPVAKDPVKSQGPMSALATPVLDELIVVVLYHQYAKQNRIEVSDVNVDREMEKANAQLPAGRKLQDIRFASGRTGDDVRQEYRDMLTVQRVEEQVQDRFTTGTPTDEELRAYVLVGQRSTTPTAELRASHIVFRARDDMSPQQIEDARSRAEVVLKKLRNGSDFVTTARQFSQDRRTAAKGGDLGYFTAGTMFPEFDKAVLGLKVGEVSEIVRTPVGFHIIKLTERHADNAHGMWFASQRQQALTNFRDKLKKSAKIERFL